MREQEQKEANIWGRLDRFRVEETIEQSQTADMTCGKMRRMREELKSELAVVRLKPIEPAYCDSSEHFETKAGPSPRARPSQNSGKHLRRGFVNKWKPSLPPR